MYVESEMDVEYHLRNEDGEFISHAYAVWYHHCSSLLVDLPFRKWIGMMSHNIYLGVFSVEFFRFLRRQPDAPCSGQLIQMRGIGRAGYGRNPRLA